MGIFKKYAWFLEGMKEIFTIGYPVTDLPTGDYVVCGNKGKVTCLPFVGARKFCLKCAALIMRK